MVLWYVAWLVSFGIAFVTCSVVLRSALRAERPARQVHPVYQRRLGHRPSGIIPAPLSRTRPRLPTQPVVSMAQLSLFLRAMPEQGAARESVARLLTPEPRQPEPSGSAPEPVA